MIKLITNISSADKNLYITGLIHLILAMLFLILGQVDDRMISVENAWLKPLRFAFSIWLFTWTFAWITSLYSWKKMAKILNILISVCMFIEIALISMQAARGVPSHFNVSTSLDAMIFSIMGAVIGFNTVLIGCHFLLFLYTKKNRSTYNKAVIWGMILFLIGNFSGYLMIYTFSSIIHSPVNETGIWFTNWQPGNGDLRIAHFLGLHAIQVLPFSSWIIQKMNLSNHFIHLIGTVYLLILAVTNIYPLTLF